MSMVSKFEAPLADRAEIRMPAGARPLSVGQQRPGYLVIWALVPDPSKPDVWRSVRIAETGRPLNLGPEGGNCTCPDCARRIAGEFLGTVQEPDGLVWHVFVSPERVA